MNNYTITETHTTASPLIRSFLERHHYIKSLPRGCSKVFCLWLDKTLVGVAAYGYPVGRMATNKYSIDLELKRFCLEPNCIKNTASWFISRTLKILKKENYKGVITYADTEQGHTGSIYKASNFEILGPQKYRTPYRIINNKKVFSRNVYQNNKYVSDKSKTLYNKAKLIFRYLF